MNERTKTGLEILLVAVIVGVFGDVLLRATPWGINVPIFNAAFAAGMITVLRRHAPQYLTLQTYSLFGALLFFASMFMWRDSIELRIADSAAILAILSALFMSRMKVTQRLAGVFHYVVGFAWASLSAIGAPFLLIFSDLEWSDIPRDGWRKHAFPALRGVAIAAPLILVFGGLFMAADAAYEGLVKRVFDIMPETIFTHVLLFAIFSWLTAGYLRGALLKGVISAISSTEPEGEGVNNKDSDASRVDRVREESGEYPVTLGGNSIVDHLNISDPPNRSEGPSEDPKIDDPEPKKTWQWANIDNGILPAGFTLGPVEVGVILGMMNLLFLSFVIVQVPYLFGGMELVQNTPDFKLAEYARRGFGELVAVSALVLPTLLVGHWLIRKDSPFAGKLFRVLAGSQIALLFVIMASAVQRLVLLTGSLGYGMTTIRLYPMIFMTWLAIVFVWFGFTVLRGARQHFAWGALWSAFLILGATHVLDPDRFIVKTNVALMREGREFDANYNSSLSDDALLALFLAVPEMTAKDQQTVAARLARRYCQMRAERDLRSFNLSRQQALTFLDSATDLKATVDCDNGPFMHVRSDD